MRALGSVRRMLKRGEDPGQLRGTRMLGKDKGVWEERGD